MKDVAVGIIRREGRILICQRRKTARYPLKWEFPGGKLEEGESPEEALFRELREELRIDAVVGREYHRQEWSYPGEPADPRNGTEFRIFYFEVPSYHGTLLNRAFEDVRWVFPNELSEMDILEGNREAVTLLVGDEQKKQA